MTEQCERLRRLRGTTGPGLHACRLGATTFSWLRNEDVICEKTESNWASVDLNQTLESHDTLDNIYTTGVRGMLSGQQAKLLLH